VDGDVNPVRDLETIGEELRLKDEEQLMQNFEKLDRVVNRGGDKKLKPEYVCKLPGFFMLQFV
jgi:obg-like ATPase 1